MLEDLPVETILLILYHYIPSKSAAIAALVLYILVTIAVTAVTLKTRAFFMLTVSITGILEVLGWSTRLIMLSKPSLKVYAVHQGLLIISPVLLAIVEYITLGRLLTLGRNSSTGSARFAKYVKTCFTCSDIFCLLLQSTGGGMYGSATSEDRINMARNLLLAGLGAQLVFFSAFICLTIYVQNSQRYFKGDTSFRYVFACLYATTWLMHVRNIYRVVEFAQGFEGTLAVNEYYLFIFDFAPIYACFLLFTFMNYGLWLGPAAPAMVERMAVKRAQLPITAVAAVANTEVQQCTQPPY